MENIYETISKFKYKNNIEKIIAFCGGYEIYDELDEQGKNKNNGCLIKKIITEGMEVFKDYNVAILNGGTEWEVPDDSSRIAKEYGLNVIGVLPKKGNKNPNLDLDIVIEPLYDVSDYGDETQVLAKLADGAIFMGGGCGTSIELFQMMKINTRKINKKFVPTYISPICGTGGITDMIYNFDFLAKEREIIMPKEKIYDGVNAAKYIINRLKLNRK